jgi:hypothetical protein
MQKKDNQVNKLETVIDFLVDNSRGNQASLVSGISEYWKTTGTVTEKQLVCIKSITRQVLLQIEAANEISEMIGDYLNTPEAKRILRLAI